MIGQAQVMEGVATAPRSLASFSFSTTGSVTDYTASISWGDGTTSAGQINEGASGVGTVVGSHNYTSFGTEMVSVTVTGDGNTKPAARAPD